MEADTEAEQRFRVMGSDAQVLVVGQRAELLVGRARRRAEELERRWSRFLEDSEISQLNRRAGQAVAVTWETRHLVERAIDGWRLSGGRVDPTVLGDVLRAGYVRSLDEPSDAAPGPGRSPSDPGGTPPGRAGIASSAAAARASGAPWPCRGCDQIVVGPRTVRLPAGCGFDPGGVGKGLAADLVASDLLAAGAEGVCVNFGGDVRVIGRAPGGGGWTVAVGHPWTSAPLGLFGLAGGGVATSTTLRRRWLLDGRPMHHLIDTGTGRPSLTDLTQATVIAAESWIAEVLAKDVLLRGSSDPFRSVAALGAEAFAVDDEGRIYATAGLSDFLGGAALPGQLPDRERSETAVPDRRAS